jgi:pimeloyl-ACP methyl ester carboxylesterase
LTPAARANFEGRAATVEAGGTAAIVDGVIANGIGPQAKERYPERVERFRASLLASPAKPYAASCRAVASLDFLPRLAARFEAYGRPVLVLRGDQDGSLTPDAAHRLAAAFPNGRYEEIADSGHNTPFENAEAFTLLVREFVLQTAGAAR